MSGAAQGFLGFMATHGYDDQGQFDQDEMELAYEAGRQAAVAAAAAAQPAFREWAEASGLSNEFERDFGHEHLAAAFAAGAAAAQPASGDELQPGEIVYLYHWRFDRGEEFGLYRHAADADAKAAEHAGDGLSEVLSMAILAPGSTHVGRSWDGHDIEDECPCPKAPCGLVVQETAAQECDEHPLSAGRTIRQGHRADQCPAGPAAPAPAPGGELAMLRADIDDYEKLLAKWPKCPAGCNCRIGIDTDPDANECGCDGPCNGGEQPAHGVTAEQLRAAVEDHEPAHGMTQWYVTRLDIDCDADEFWAVISAELAKQPAPTAAPGGGESLSEHVSVRFPADMIAAAKHLAEAEGMTVSAWIRREVEREAARREQAAPVTVAPAVARPPLGSTLVLALHPDQDDETARKGEEAIRAATADEGVTVVTVRGIEALRIWEPAAPAPEPADIPREGTALYLAAIARLRAGLLEVMRAIEDRHVRDVKPTPRTGLEGK